MKNRLINFYELFKDDQTLIILTCASFFGSALIYILSQFIFNSTLPLPTLISYIFIINTILSFTVISKDRFTARLLMSFNLVIDLICLIYLLKSSL